MSRLKHLSIVLGASFVALGLGCNEIDSPIAPPVPEATVAPVPEKSSDPSISVVPEFHPDDFVRRVDNPYFPLVPGTTFHYRGTSEDTPTRNIVEVTDETKRILGVRVTVVRDRAYEDGVLVEDTFDWFAQDERGNVWYFGEDTKELDEDGNVVSTEGSWIAGEDGAEPGIIMLARPRAGDRYNQENAPGVAEDRAEVMDLDAEIRVRNREYENVLVIEETTPLEPEVRELKYYARGVGFIESRDISGGDEVSELVRITRERRNSDDDDGDDDD